MITLISLIFLLAICSNVMIYFKSKEKGISFIASAMEFGILLWLIYFITNILSFCIIIILMFLFLL
jgi:hypothetical protein